MNEAVLTKKLVHGNVKFVKDWTPLNWIAYGSLGTTAILTAINAAAKENSALSNWFSPFLKTYVLGYGPAIFFIIASIIFIYQKIKGGKVAKAGKATTVFSVSGPVLPPTLGLAKPKKFYSERNKSDLANALTDLSEILNANGANIAQKAQQIVMIWSGELRGNKMPDTAALIGQLNDLGNLTAVLNRAIFDDDGFVKKYQTYADELKPVLQLPPPQIALDNPIAIFQTSINGFRDVLSSIDFAKKYNDQELISYMIRDSRLAFSKYMNGISVFRGWLDETQKRINTFRNSQL